MQSTMFETSVKVQRETAEWGTFRDSLKAPVHGWFTYPAGFSYKAVEYSIKKSGLQEGFATIYDPFMGSERCIYQSPSLRNIPFVMANFLADSKNACRSL